MEKGEGFLSSMVELLLGVDVGTSGVKALLVDRGGTVVASGHAELDLHTPRPLWSEQDPEDWWQAACRSVREALDQVDGLVVGVGLTGQMHGSVFLGAGGNVIRPAILWNDQRTEAECREIEQRVPRLVEITCNPALTGFTAPKILWLRNHEPDNYRRVKTVLLPKDYIRYRLTGQYFSEVSDASGTSLLDVPARRWSEEILGQLEIPADWMPPLGEGPEPTTKVTNDDWGVPIGTPVVGGGGDQAAGAVGVGSIQEGVVSTAIGTSGVVFSALDSPSVDPQLSAHTFCHAVPGKWHVMGVMLSAAGSLRWFRDTFCPGESYDSIAQMGATVPAGAEGLFFLPYLSGERSPHKNPNARAVFFGATLAHTKAHFARAVFEGVAYGLRDSYELLKGMGIAITEARATGGGARSDFWLQVLSDVTNAPHVRVNVDEGPSYGAALLAGVGIGWWPSVEEACRACIVLGNRIEPDAGNVASYEKGYQQFQALYTDLLPQFRTDR